MHASYHPALRRFATRYGFTDILLADAETGEVVYSVNKEIDLGTSLKDGPFAMTNAGRAFQQAAMAKWNGFYSFADFERYTPSGGEPSAFIAAPILDGDKRVGVAIIELPLTQLDTLLGAVCRTRPNGRHEPRRPRQAVPHQCTKRERTDYVESELRD